uniref:Protein kinase domain-containing protein n=1 Tax=Macrostomum lignano TaxID=282301 RepID=A0A1I8FNX0_9PLAT
KLKHENLVNLLEVFRRKERRLYLVSSTSTFTVLDNLEALPQRWTRNNQENSLSSHSRRWSSGHKCNTIHPRHQAGEAFLVSRGGIVKIWRRSGSPEALSGEPQRTTWPPRWYLGEPSCSLGDPAAMES